MPALTLLAIFGGLLLIAFVIGTLATAAKTERRERERLGRMTTFGRKPIYVTHLPRRK